MTTNIKTLIQDAIQSVSDKLRKHNITLHNRIIDGLADLQSDYGNLNKGLLPTIDNLYRFHAPADGYIDINREVYLKGQFLPTTNVSEIVRRASFGDNVNHSTRILSFKEIADVVFEEAYGNGIIEVKLGRDFEQAGNHFVYIYLNGPRFLVNHFSSLIEEVKVEREKAFKKTKLTGTAPTGREEIVGRVVNISEKVDDNFNRLNRKVMIINDDDSFSTYGNLNSNAYNAVEVGDIIKFRATFKHSDSKEHAFFSRMSNFEIVKKGQNNQ